MSQGFALDPTILREYDIRGVVGKTLTEDAARAVGRAFGTLVSEAGGRKVAVGFDGRLSSPSLQQALTEGLTSVGCDVVQTGRGPTPMLYFANSLLGTDGAMMVTGSHNPPEYNGIKMILKGHAFCGADIQKLGKVAAAGKFSQGKGQVSSRPVFDDYIDRLVKGYSGKRPLRVAWDPGNGATGDVVVALTKRLPGEHFLINETIDGTFPNHHPDPTVEKNLQQLKDLIASKKCDLGFGFDGDGDRIGVVDSQGRVLWGDQILLVLAEEVLAEVPGATIIADVKASQVLFDGIEKLGGKPLMWKSGHSLIKTKMHELHAPLAGEMSGHIFFGHNYYGFDDALYGAVRLLTIVGNSERSIGEMRDAMPRMLNTPELRFPCPENRKLPVVAEVKQRLAAAKGIKVNDIDGVRVLDDDGWWLLRASNTEAVLVARCESKSKEGLERLKKTLIGQLSKSGIAAPDFG
jgi:phosphomannomutase